MPSALLATGSFQGTRDKITEGCALVSAIGQGIVVPRLSGNEGIDESVITESIENGRTEVGQLQTHSGRCNFSHPPVWLYRIKLRSGLSPNLTPLALRREQPIAPPPGNYSKLLDFSVLALDKDIHFQPVSVGFGLGKTSPKMTRRIPFDEKHTGAGENSMRWVSTLESDDMAVRHNVSSKP